MAPQVNATHRCLHEQLLAAEAARGTLVLDVQNVHHVRSDGIGAGTLRSCAPPADLAEDYSPLDPAPELLFETLLLFLVGILLLVGLLTAAAACCIILLLLPSPPRQPPPPPHAARSAMLLAGPVGAGEGVGDPPPIRLRLW